MLYGVCIGFEGDDGIVCVCWFFILEEIVDVYIVGEEGGWFFG